MNKYLAALREEGRTAFYMHEKERILKLIFRTAGMKKLRDLTADRLDHYLAQMTKGTGKVRGLPVAASTKMVHRTAAHAFANWLKRKGRFPNNPLENVAKPQGKAVRERRSLTPAELQKLLAAARERPLRDAMTNTGGRRAALGEHHARRGRHPAEAAATVHAALGHPADDRHLRRRNSLRDAAGHQGARSPGPAIASSVELALRSRRRRASFGVGMEGEFVLVGCLSHGRGASESST
jgi:hypothetical protein